jgi:cysteine desulfurase
MLLKKKKDFDLVCNFTYINNETGIVWPLELAAQIKQATGAFVHVDAVQLIGKIKDWKILNATVDAYTFSGHKFGAMKGVGFSFIKKDISFLPLLAGGNQQEGMRSGTENALGIYSLKLALEDMLERFDAEGLSCAFDLIESELLKVIGERGEIIGAKNNYRNLTTCFLMLRNQKAELLSAKFDMLGMDVSTGSACSSGVIKENRILRAMGYSEEESRSAIRFSFSPFMNLEEAIVYVERMSRALS